MTYSVIARDPVTGRIGIAVQSHWFAVGRIVPWARAGVGGVAIQANGDPRLGPKSLELMSGGRTATEAIASLMVNDPRQGVTQIAMVDAAGNVGAHTGAGCFPEAGHISGEDWSVQANLMARPTVPEAMARAYDEAHPRMQFVDRLLAALQAAENEGGDLRGRQSAAILIVESGDAPRVDGCGDVVVNVRVDDHADPLGEIERLAKLALAYRENELGLALSESDFPGALEHWERAAELAPENAELAFWRAVGLAEASRLDEARLAFQIASADSDVWSVVLGRLERMGFAANGRGFSRFAAMMAADG